MTDTRRPYSSVIVDGPHKLSRAMLRAVGFAMRILKSLKSVSLVHGAW